MAQGLRTSPADIPVINEELYTLVARMTKAKQSTVKDIIQFTGSFIADTISSGTMQGVMIPYFGKFKPKKERVMHKWTKKAQMANGANVVSAALAGKELKPKPTTKP